jgi:S1-C subfamily serine protease
MQAACFVFAVMILLVSSAPAKAVGSHLTAAQKNAIGRKIWQNECAGSVTGLTTWNAGEEFPSLGIGHFIWYPEGFKGRFDESWPHFVAFARKQGASLPAVALEAHSPWRTKAQFQADFKSSRMTALRSWLAGNVGMQTEFIISRSRAALPKILAAAPASERARIEQNYHKVAATSQGTYALIDYVNFKGEGIQATEKYKGQGWGLMQVLGGMKDVPSGAAAATEFAASAKRILSRRIANSPPERGEKRWEEGWHNRCASYARPL